MKKYTDFVFQIDADESSTSGIYAIVNSVNNDKYIGSAVNFRKRYSVHRATLKKGVHHSPKLQALVNEHGLSILKFQRLEACPIADLPTREDYYLAAYLPAFNTSLSYYHPPMLGKQHSLASRLKMAKAKKGKKANTNQRAALLAYAVLPKSDNTKAKIGERNRGVNNGMYGTKAVNALAVLQYDGTGQQVAEYDSLKSAMEATGVDFRNIQTVCKGRRKMAGGYIWKYKTQSL